MAFANVELVACRRVHHTPVLQIPDAGDMAPASRRHCPTWHLMALGYAGRARLVVARRPWHVARCYSLALP